MNIIENIKSSQTGTNLALRDNTMIPEPEDNADSQSSIIGPSNKGDLQGKNNDTASYQSTNHILWLAEKVTHFIKI